MLCCFVLGTVPLKAIQCVSVLRSRFSSL